MRRTFLAGAAAALLAISRPPLAQQPVRIVVPFPAGGTVDFIARAIAVRLQDAEARPFFVDNRSGANGNLGVEHAARAAPDGSTLLMAGTPTHSINPHLYSTMGFDPLDATAPVAMVATGPNLLVVHPALGVSSLAELVTLARSRPGAVEYASGGSGSTGHLAGEMLKAAAGIDLLHVPYRAFPAAVTDLVAGRVPVMFLTPPALLPHLRSGTLRAIATSGPARSSILPDVPTIAELGYPGFDADAWYGLFAPRDTPHALRARLSARIAAAVADPAFRTLLERQGVEPRHMAPEPFATFLREDSTRWGEAVRRSGARID